MPTMFQIVRAQEQSASSMAKAKSTEQRLDTDRLLAISKAIEDINEEQDRLMALLSAGEAKFQNVEGRLGELDVSLTALVSERDELEVRKNVEEESGDEESGEEDVDLPDPEDEDDSMHGASTSGSRTSKKRKDRESPVESSKKSTVWAIPLDRKVLLFFSLTAIFLIFL